MHLVHLYLASDPRNTVVSIECEARYANSHLYCKNIVDGQELQVDSIDYCHLVDVPDIIDNLLSAASTSQGDSAYTGGKAWKTKAVPTYNYNAMIALSTGGAATGDLETTIQGRIKKTQFQPEDFDILDQQCYSLMTADRKEFDSIHCEAANHKRLGGSGKQNLLTANYVSNPNDFLNNDDGTAANVDDGDDDCDDDDVTFTVEGSQIKRSGCGYKQLLGSRYQNQEYCLSNKDKTMFKELFGCADDQRESCREAEGTYYEDDQCETEAEKGKDLYKIIDAGTPDEACVSVPNDCAGGIDEDVIAQHADYLPDNWASGHKNFKYGENSDADYICSEVEIVVANELSSYLDRTDHDITKACEHAIDTFDKASEAYVDFIDPLAIRVGRDDDQTTPEDESLPTYHNLYSVLREAWRQAEFTLRSIKIQEQVRDRMLKYRDWTLGRFDKVTSAETGETQINNNLEAPGGLTPRIASYVNSRDVYRNFLDEWDGYIKDYEKLSLAEIKALRIDLDDILKEVAEAKEFAQELANTQQAASAAVATVSIHFRKKLNFWVQMESLIEQAFKDSLNNAKALQDQTHRSHLNANYARTDVHEPPEDEGFDYQVTRAEIQAGKDYNGFEGRTYQDGQIQNQGTAQRKPGGEAISSSSSFESDYDCASLSKEESEDWVNICVGQCKVDDEEAPTACVQKDAERKSEFTSSNAAITTSLKCGTNNTICEVAFGYTDANQPTLNRVSSCVGGYCQIAASNVVSDNSAVSKQTIEIEPTDTNYHGIATDKSVADDSAPHGGVAKEDDGSYSNHYVNSEKANIKFTHTVENDLGSSEVNRKITGKQINNYDSLENAENAITDVDGQEPTGQLRDSATNKRTNDNSNPPAAADEGDAADEGGAADEGDADEGGAAACDSITDALTCGDRDDCFYDAITLKCGASQNNGDLGDVLENP
jgi:hypothetical protein